MKCPNKNHKDWKAIVDKYGENVAWASYIKNGEVIPSLSYVDELINKDNKNYDKDLQYITNVRDSITTILEQLGVGIGVLDQYTERLGIEGVNHNGNYDPKAIKKVGEDLVTMIKIADNEQGLRALPEEFSHFVNSVLKAKNDPLYSRMITFLDNDEQLKNILGEEYDKYASAYSTREDLVEEALAKLMAKSIIKKEKINNFPAQSLLQRFLDKIKQIFKGKDWKGLLKNITQAEQELDQFTIKLMTGNIDLNINLDSIRGDSIKRNMTNAISTGEENLKNIIETRIKQLEIEKNNLEENDSENLKSIISRLEVLKNSKNIEGGILMALEEANKELSEIYKKAQEVKINKDSSISDINNVAKYLRYLKRFSDAYTPLLKNITSYVNSLDNRETIGLEPALDALYKTLRNVESEYTNNATPIFLEFIRRFTGNLMGTKVGDKVFTEQTLLELIKYSEKDIGVMDRYLNSMSNASDLILRLIERPTKELNFKRRERVHEISKELLFELEKLEKAGYDQSFIYEKDDKGNYTGNLIQELNYDKYNSEFKEMQEKLTRKYGNPSTSPKSNLWYKEYYEWKELNSKNGFPIASKYTNNVFKTLSPAQKTFYNHIISLKEELDAYLPNHDNQGIILAPQIRKDSMGVLKDSNGIKNLLNNASSIIGDKFLDRESDDEFGNRNVLKDFDGTQHHSLPIYYKNKLDNPNNISLDIVGGMTLYADMAINYNNMNSIIDIMEVGKDILRKREIQDTKGRSKLVEKIKSNGREIQSRVIKPEGTSNFIARLNEFYSNQIYGIRQKDEGNIKIPFTKKNVSKAKLANFANWLTALNTYALNTLGSVANVITGKNMIRIEALAGEYFGVKESAQADQYYGKWLPGVISDIGNRRNKSILSLLGEKFNVMQEYEKDIRDLKANQKNILTRWASSSSVFFMAQCGEHYLQNKSFLALAIKYKLKDKNGKEINLLDAYEVKKNQKGIEALHLKEGVTKLDGSEFTDNDVMKFSRKIAKINQDLHGIYNQEDMNAIQTSALGRIAYMYRKWMPSAYIRRMGKPQYNFELDSNVEGFYRPMGRFLRDLGLGIYHSNLNLQTMWGELSDHDKSNIKRAMAEIGTFALIVATFWLGSAMWDGDDDWYKSMTLYQLRRQITELGVMIPTGATQLSEGYNILKSPAAGIDYTKKVFGILNFQDIFKEPYQSGPYKGWNRYAVDILRPLPYHNNIRKAFTPEDSMQAFNN